MEGLSIKPNAARDVNHFPSSQKPTVFIQNDF